jgi:hypothetical protein
MAGDTWPGVRYYLNLKGTRGNGFKDSSEMLKNYKELKVWQKSYEPCLEIYGITAKFPKEERQPQITYGNKK